MPVVIATVEAEAGESFAPEFKTRLGNIVRSILNNKEQSTVHTAVLSSPVA